MVPSAKQARLMDRLSDRGHINRALGSVRWVAECGSTNTVLADEVRSGDTSFAVLVTDRQTAGKGRLGRVWEAPVGSALTMSIRTLVPGDPPAIGDVLGLLPLVVGVAALQTVTMLGASPERVELKWPNDLMDPKTGRKLAGVLCEAIPSPSGVAVVIGVGINLTRPEHVDGVVAERAQWIDQLLTEATGVDPVSAASELLDRVHAGLELLLNDPYAARELVATTCATIGRRVRVEQQAGALLGTAIGLDPSGALMMQLDDGNVCTVRAGDVVHLRPDHSGQALGSQSQ
jgi:BirA family transcriptional regulator, biotin operon repressor / biotin---[acetyl-CoA-carboxylase] ligase